MIKLTPPWEGPNRDELLRLYYFLLYKTLPFAPETFLPLEGDRPFYHDYTDYDFSSTALPEKKYPDAPGHRIRVGHLLSPVEISALLRTASPALHDYLYTGGTQPNRERLRTLLFTLTDEKGLAESGIAIPKPASDKGKDDIQRIFNYTHFSKMSQPFARLIQLMGVEVCPYCNRSFTTTVKRAGGDFLRQNQADHFRPKDRYPWFALTLPNLIPSCGACNHVKLDDDRPLLYPYRESLSATHRFRTKPVRGGGGDYLMGVPGTESRFTIQLEPRPDIVPDPDHLNRSENSISKLGLREMYQTTHNGMVRRVLEQRYILGDAYLKSLADAFPGHFKSEEEVREMLYLRSVDPARYDDTPLSMLLHDIDEEINELNQRNKP